ALDEPADNRLQSTSIDDDDPGETLKTDSAHEPLGGSIGTSDSDRHADDPNAFRAKVFVEAGRELGAAFPDQEPDRFLPLGKFETQIPDPVGPSRRRPDTPSLLSRGLFGYR